LIGSIKTNEVNVENKEFIEKYKDIDKYLLFSDGFLKFEFVMKDENVEIKVEGNPVFDLHIDNKIVKYNEYDPLKLTNAGNMMISEKCIMYTKYDDKMIFCLV
jgi:hypothetical protein